MPPPGSPSLSVSQLATLAALGEERTARVGDVLYGVGDATYPFIAIRDGADGGVEDELACGAEARVATLDSLERA